MSRTPFDTRPVSAAPVVTAPDGSQVSVLLALAGGSMARFDLPAGAVARAVVHHHVEELWYVVQGRGQMWRRQDGREETVALEPGLCLSLPAGTHFQFRAAADEGVSAVGVTMPPWPGDDAAQVVPGPWAPSA